MKEKKKRFGQIFAFIYTSIAGRVTRQQTQPTPSREKFGRRKVYKRDVSHFWRFFRYHFFVKTTFSCPIAEPHFSHTTNFSHSELQPLFSPTL